MFKKFTSLCFSFVFTLVFTVTLAHADKYPGTSIDMQAGDVLYSSKTGSSTFVGHVAIVGPDFKIYHVNATVDRGYTHDGGKVDDMRYYQKRHTQGEEIEIFRTWSIPTQTKDVIANWAKSMAPAVTEYKIPFLPWIDDQRLETWNPSYCSKFVWQAYYYGSGYKDILGTKPPRTALSEFGGEGFQDYVLEDRALIAPMEFKASRSFAKIGSFIASH